MARRKKGGGRTTPRKTRPINWEDKQATPPFLGMPEPAPPPVQEHMAELVAALHGNPVELMNLASLLVDSYLRTEEESLGSRREPDRKPLIRLLDDFSRDREPAVNALGLAGAVLLDDSAVLRRIQRHTANAAGLPTWLRELDAARVVTVTETAHPYRDGAAIAVAVEFADQQVMTTSVYMSNHSGYAIADVLAFAGTAEELEQAAKEQNDDPHVSIEAMDPTVAHRRLTTAIQYTQMMWPPIVNESWPLYQPLTEWTLRLLPEPTTPEEDWEPTSPEERDKITDAFFASAHARDVDLLPDHVELLLEYKDGYGNRELFRWNPTEVEIFLVDWVLRKVAAPDEVMRGFPNALRSFIPFAHAQLDFPQDLTKETVGAIDQFEAAFLAGLEEDRKTGVEGLVQKMRDDGMFPDA